MNPLDAKLILDALDKLFAEQDARWDRRFADLDTAWDRRSAPPSSTRAVGKQQDAAIPLGIGTLEQYGAAQAVSADNWGGLFGHHDAAERIHINARPSAVPCDAPVDADKWGGLFKEPTCVMEGRDYEPAASDAASSSPKKEWLADDAAATEYTSDDPDEPTCVRAARTASASQKVEADSPRCPRCHATTLAKTSPALFTPGAPRPSLKYQLPQDYLYSLTFDDDYINIGRLPTRAPRCSLAPPSMGATAADPTWLDPPEPPDPTPSFLVPPSWEPQVLSVNSLSGGILGFLANVTVTPAVPPHSPVACSARYPALQDLLCINVLAVATELGASFFLSVASDLDLACTFTPTTERPAPYTNLLPTKCSMQIHNSTSCSSLLLISTIALASFQLTSTTALMIVAPFPASMTASTSGVNSSSNIIDTQGMAASRPLIVAFVDIIAPVKHPPVYVLVVTSKPVSVALDTEWMLDEVPHNQQWPSFSAAYAVLAEPGNSAQLVNRHSLESLNSGRLPEVGMMCFSLFGPVLITAVGNAYLRPMSWPSLTIVHEITTRGCYSLHMPTPARENFVLAEMAQSWKCMPLVSKFFKFLGIALSMMQTSNRCNFSQGVCFLCNANHICFLMGICEMLGISELMRNKLLKDQFQWHIWPCFTIVPEIIIANDSLVQSLLIESITCGAHSVTWKFWTWLNNYTSNMFMLLKVPWSPCVWASCAYVMWGSAGNSILAFGIDQSTIIWDPGPKLMPFFAHSCNIWCTGWSLLVQQNHGIGLPACTVQVFPLQALLAKACVNTSGIGQDFNLIYATCVLRTIGCWIATTLLSVKSRIFEGTHSSMAFKLTHVVILGNNPTATPLLMDSSGLAVQHKHSVVLLIVFMELCPTSVPIFSKLLPRNFCVCILEGQQKLGGLLMSHADPLMLLVYCAMSLPGIYRRIQSSLFVGVVTRAKLLLLIKL